MARPSPVIDSGIFGVSVHHQLGTSPGSVSGTEEVQVEKWTVEAYVAQSMLVSAPDTRGRRRTRREDYINGDAALARC